MVEERQRIRAATKAAREKQQQAEDAEKRAQEERERLASERKRKGRAERRRAAAEALRRDAASETDNLSRNRQTVLQQERLSDAIKKTERLETRMRYLLSTLGEGDELLSAVRGHREKIRKMIEDNEVAQDATVTNMDIGFEAVSREVQTLWDMFHNRKSE